MSKPVSPAWLAMAAGRQFFIADCYTFSGGQLGNNILRYCAADRDVSFNGILYPSGGQVGPYFDRWDNKAKINASIGLTVDQMIVDIIPGAAQVFGVPFLTALHNGAFDGCDVYLDRLYMPTWGDTSRGPMRMFVGRLAEVDGGRLVMTLTINTHVELLNLPFPRNLYQPLCVNNLGDPACGVNINSFKQSSSALSGSTAGSVLGNLASYSAGNFDQGMITFTSGVNSGITRGVRSVTGTAPGTITLVGQLPNAPAPGDSFNLFFGCDKTSSLALVLQGNVVTGGTKVISTQSPQGVIIGMSVTGSGVPANTVVTNIVGTGIDTNNPLSATTFPTNYTFTSLNGCGKFSNQARYKGFRFVPQPATAAVPAT